MQIELRKTSKPLNCDLLLVAPWESVFFFQPCFLKYDIRLQILWLLFLQFDRRDCILWNFTILYPEFSHSANYPECSLYYSWGLGKRNQQLWSCKSALRTSVTAKKIRNIMKHRKNSPPKKFADQYHLVFYYRLFQVTTYFIYGGKVIKVVKWRNPLTKDCFGLYFMRKSRIYGEP